ncbi:MAG: hypothetical protein JSV64_03155, partial [Candidatus Bathyarchaeota archaeon]
MRREKTIRDSERFYEEPFIILRTEAIIRNHSPQVIEEVEDMTEETPEKTEKVETPEKTEKVETPEKTEKVETPEKTEKVETPEKT